MVDQLYHLPIMYIEYSGIYGDVEKVKSVAETLTSTQLFYGGGISTLSAQNGQLCAYNCGWRFNLYRY